MKLHRPARRTFKFKRWLPALFGILVMALLGAWFDVARYFLFTHHMFWIVGAILLINPIAETFWPAKKRRKQSSVYSTAAQSPVHASKHTSEQAPVSTKEPAAERLAHLHKEQAAVERKIAKMAAGKKEQTR